MTRQSVILYKISDTLYFFIRREILAMDKLRIFFDIEIFLVSQYIMKQEVWGLKKFFVGQERSVSKVFFDI